MKIGSGGAPRVFFILGRHSGWGLGGGNQKIKWSDLLVLLVVEGVYNAVFFPSWLQVQDHFAHISYLRCAKDAPSVLLPSKDTHADVRADKLYSIYIHRHTICDVYVYIYIFIYTYIIYMYIYIYVHADKKGKSCISPPWLKNRLPLLNIDSRTPSSFKVDSYVRTLPMHHVKDRQLLAWWWGNLEGTEAELFPESWPVGNDPSIL